MLATLSTIWTGAWLFATALSTAFSDVLPLSSLTAVAAVALLTALAAVAIRQATALRRETAPVLVRAHRSERPVRAFRLSDPDAAGRPRPRAPTQGPAA